MLKKILKRLWYGFAILVVLIAIAATIVRALSPWISNYRHDIELVASDMLGQPVVIDKIEPDWYLLEPVIKLYHITIFNDDKVTPVLKINKVSIEINLLKSLLRWQIQPRGMYISGATLHINQQQNGAYLIAGLEASEQAAATPPKQKSQKKFLSWIFAQQQVTLKRIDIILNEKRHESLPISDMSLKLHNRGNQHQLSISARLSQKVATSLQIIANFSGNGTDLNRYSGQFYVDAKNILLTQWFKNFKYQQIKINSGIAHVKAQGEFADRQINLLQSNFEFSGLNIANEKSKQQAMIPHLVTHLEWHNGASGWLLKASNFNLNLAGVQLPQNDATVAYQQKDKSYQINLHYLDLKYLKQFSKFIGGYPATFNDYLLNLQPQGELFESKLSYSAASGLTAMSTQARNISWKNWHEFPGINGLSAQLDWQSNKGKLILASNNVQINAPNYLNQAIKFAEVTGKFAWEKINDQWKISGQQIKINNNDLAFDSQFNLVLVTPLMDSTIELSSNFTLVNLLKAKAYLPYKIMKPKLVTWLKQSIISSDPTSGTLIWKGNLAKFPYDDASGIFVVEGNLNNLNLHYHPEWPMAKHINAHVIYKSRDLTGEITNAKVGNIPLTNIHAKIAYMGREPLLSIKGNVAAEASDARQFILQSALQKNLSVFHELQIQGPISADLNIVIPLSPDNDNNLVDGVIHFSNNNLVLDEWWKLTLEKLTGNLNFNQNGLLNSELTSYLFQYPLNLKVNNRGNKPQASTDITVTGKMKVEQIKRLLPDIIFNFMSGETAFNAILSLADVKTNSNSLTINSDLQGVSIKMPSPFKKEAREVKKLTLTAKFSPQNDTSLKLDYAKLINANIIYKKDNQSYSIKRGTIKIGGGNANLPAQDGLEIVGSISHFALDTWLDAFDNSSLGQTDRQDKSATILRLVNLRIKLLELLGQSYNDVLVSTSFKDKHWLINLTNKDIDGQLDIPEQLNLGIRAQLKRLSLNKIKQNTLQKNIKPQQIPPLQVGVDDFIYDGMRLGKLALSTTSRANELTINQLNLTSPSYNLSANGNWIINSNGSHKSAFKGIFTTTDLAKSLQQWNIEPVIKVKHGTINFDLYWLDSLNKFAINKLNGVAQFKFEHGLITQLDDATEQKIGLGKLLSVLSLQTLPRRLVLDFSDLSNKGFSFDYYKGSFMVNRGTMTTKDSNLDGPVAAVNMRGSLNLSAKEYDILLEISPHIGASLPIVATIAGGPVIGLATWVASKIISHEMRRVTGYSYKITGPWKHPNVQPISITEATKNE